MRLSRKACGKVSNKTRSKARSLISRRTHRVQRGKIRKHKIRKQTVRRRKIHKSDRKTR